VLIVSFYLNKLNDNNNVSFNVKNIQFFNNKRTLRKMNIIEHNKNIIIILL